MRRWLIILGMLWPLTGWGQTDSNFIAHWQSEGWNKTNFQKTRVPFKEIISGGPPRDGIPPIYHPTFESPSSASQWLPDSEPVLVHRQGEEVRAYPYRILMWHEIVNDAIHEKSFIVTFCPLCNSAIIYNTHFAGQNHLFGVSGKLRNSDMVMWDHTTDSWWQQLTGEAIVGDAVGQKLEMLPSPSLSFGEYKKIFPQGKVLSQETSHARPYGSNPYEGYDQSSFPFLMRGTLDERLPPLARVLGFEWKGQFYTLPLQALKGKKWMSFPQLEGVVVFNLSVANSALEKRSIVNSRLVDQVTVWANPDGLQFAWDGTHLRDEAQHRRWNALGQGKIEGVVETELPPVNYGVHFAFAWLAFHPESVFLEVP